MSGAIPWDVLQSQYFENSVYEKELRQMIHSPEDVSKVRHKNELSSEKSQ